MGILLNPTVNRMLSALDDSASMTSVVMRDGVDNLGRITQAYKRDANDGRERLIEETFTTLIWGFGIRWVKELVYDPLARKFLKLRHPAFDMTLLKKGPQQLTADVVKKYAPHDAHLLEMVTKPALQKKYQLSHITKFGFATGLPVLAIAFGIPTLNQWLTRKKVDEANALKRPAMKKQRSLQGGNAFTGFERQLQRPGGANPFAVQPGKQGVKFGGIGEKITDGISNLLQNERANTLLVDGTISGGRALKARNKYERLEVIFQEAGIIYFLYYAQGFIQNKIQGLIDKVFQTRTGLGFGELKHLRENFASDAGQFLHANTPIQKLLEDRAQADVNGRLTAFETQLVDKIRQYVMDGKDDHMLFELAKKSGIIPTTTDASGRVLPDLTQKIQLNKLMSLGEQLQKVAIRLEENPAGIENLLRRSMGYKAGAFFISGAICSLFLGYVIPKLKQAMTEKLTGSKAFPGVMQ